MYLPTWSTLLLLQELGVLSFTSSILSEPFSENYPHSEPETDSKGYEIVKDDASGYQTQMRIIQSNRSVI